MASTASASSTAWVSLGGEFGSFLIKIDPVVLPRASGFAGLESFLPGPPRLGRLAPIRPAALRHVRPPAAALPADRLDRLADEIDGVAAWRQIVGDADRHGG